MDDCRLFVIICRLFVVIVGTHCMRTHPILSSQRGASAEFQLRVEALQHVGVGPPRSLRLRSVASRRIYAFSRRGLGKAAALLPSVGAHLETISGRHRPCSMGMSSHLRPAAARRVGGCAATEVACGHRRPALTCFFLRTAAAM